MPKRSSIHAAMPEEVRRAPRDFPGAPDDDPNQKTQLKPLFLIEARKTSPKLISGPPLAVPGAILVDSPEGQRHRCHEVVAS